MASERARTQEAEPEETRDGSADTRVIEQLEEAIIKNAGGLAQFKKELPLLLRKAVDEVIDSARTNRFTLDEVEKTEKTYLGTKVEILLRNWLRFPKGKILDLSINGIETDIKNTMGNTWMIPSEAMGHPCLLVKINEKQARFSIGIVLMRSEHLSVGKNKDGKSSISKVGREKIYWMLKDEPYPENLWQNINPETRRKITSPSSGSGRTDELFRQIQRKPISRALVLGVAQQDDAMRRLRKNGGARDSLAPDGIALLSGKYHSALIEELGLPRCEKDEFISFTPTTESDISLLRGAGCIR